MTLFFILAGLLVVAALAAILPSALRARNAENKSDRAELDQLETNIGIAKERRHNLQVALENGTIDQSTYATELSDLENALAFELSTKKENRESSLSGMIAAGLITAFLPIASGALYLHLGTPKAINSEVMHANALAEQQEQQKNEKPPALTELLPNLERKLEANPEDRDGWKLLGKSYLAISQFKDAKRALMRAYSLDKEDPDVLAQLAEVTAMERGGDLSGKASDFIDSALKINPEHQQSLWLKALASQQSGRHEDAITRFEALRATVLDNAGAVASIDELLNQSREAIGLEVKPATAVGNESETAAMSANAADAQQTTQAEETGQSAAGSALTVSVSLAEHVKTEVAPTDSVFIFARASNGPPMPLAVSRHTVSELPVEVVLDDTMAMIPAMTLSGFPKVTVGARVSKSGNAIAQPGDWFVEQDNVELANTGALNLTIDQQK